jgi:hypothetical protein
MLNLRFHATAKQYDVIGVSERAKNESSAPTDAWSSGRMTVLGDDASFRLWAQ